MITQEVREFFLSDNNTLYSKSPKELGYTPFNVGRTMKHADKWADEFRLRIYSKYNNQPVTFEEALDYLSTYESDDKIKKTLEDLCIKAVEESLGFKFEDLKLRGTPIEAKPSLIPPTENASPAQEQEKIDEEFDEQFRLQSNRRRVLHGITACAGLKAGTNLHQLVYSELEQIDPKLIECYDIIGLRTLEDTYTQNPFQMYMMYKKAGEGEMPIQNSVETEVEEEDGEQTLSIKAKAISFNMLLHETVKGVFNLFLNLSVPPEMFAGDDESQVKLFYKESDKLEEEYFHFLSSMHMYNQLVQWCIEKDLSLIEVFKQLNICEPEDTIEFLMCLHEDEPEDLDYIWEVHIEGKKDKWEENEDN